RCSYCYLEPICDELEEVRETVATSNFEVVRFDTEWDAAQGPVYGGDPASAERSKTRREMAEYLSAVESDGSQISAEAVAATLGRSVAEVEHRKFRLPLLGVGPGSTFTKPEYPPIPAQIERA